MKYLKYILLGLVVLFVLFILKGVLSPTQTYDVEVTVDKSAKEAWAVMNDETKTMDWLKGLTKVEHISGEKGKVGAVTKYTYTENGKESYIMETMKEIVPYKKVAMDFVMDGVMTMDYTMNLEEKDGKTIVKSTTIAEGDGMFMKSLFTFMKKTMISQEEENLANLQKVINENTTDYFPAPQVNTMQEAFE